MNMRVLGICLVALLGLTAPAACGGDGDSAGSTGSTRTTGSVSKDASTRATVWAVGDGDAGDDARRVADMIARGKPDRFLYLGDVYEEGTREQFDNNFHPAYGRFDRIAAPTPGNHDWPNHAAGYDPYWKAVGLVTNRHYYAFRTAGWEIVSLNSESGLERGSPQRRWLQQRVRRRSTCRIAFWHRPFLNAGKHGDQRETAPLWNAVRGRAALVLNGHDHDLQAFKRRSGLVELIAGAGGHGLYHVNGNDPRLAWEKDDQFGALRLDLRPGVARYRFMVLPGRTVHSGSVRCKRPLR
jgi:Calcineurin-like phosphoesterase